MPISPQLPQRAITDNEVVHLDDHNRINQYLNSIVEGQPGVPRGTWNVAVAYDNPDIVTHEGSSYIARGPSTGSEPLPDNSNLSWQLLSEAGAPGASGATTLDELTDVNAPTPADGSALVWRDVGGAWVPEVISAGGAKTNEANTWTEDQTIEANNVLFLGTAGASGQAGSSPFHSYNARFDGTNWVRLLADNDASHVALAANGDLVFYTNTDAGNTVGSIITWGEKFRIAKNGSTTFTSFIRAIRDTAAGNTWSSQVTGDSQDRFAVRADGQVEWGPGGVAARDTNLYRVSANTLGTDDAFSAGVGTNWLIRLLDVGGLPAVAFGPPSAPAIICGTGTPEGVVSALVGSLYMRRDGGAGTSFYVKQSGTGNTGWVGK